MCRERRGARARARHARFHMDGVSYHVVLRVVQGRYLLRPDAKAVFQRLVAGVIGRAQCLYPTVQLFADAWLSNHAHLLLRGSAAELPFFVGFVEREISRRWGRRIDWPGPMFLRYLSTALPSHEDELHAFAYVLSQSVKEGLVSDPRKWPGPHCARDLCRGFIRRGTWFDGTSYSKAVHGGREATPRWQDHERSIEMRFEKLPALRDLSDEEYRLRVAEIVGEVIESAQVARARSGGKVAGRRRVLRTPRLHRSPAPRPPWWSRGRRLICWSGRRTSEARSYTTYYWEFQNAFREASERFRAGELGVAFPAGAFRPISLAGP